MKHFKILTLLVLCLALFSCDRGADSIDKAFDLASNKATAVEVAKTLSHGDVDCKTLTIDEYAKLGACLNYISADINKVDGFYIEVDSANYTKLVDEFNFTLRTDRSEKERRIKKLTAEILGK